MKPLLRILSVFFTSLFLAACGSEDGNNFPIAGSWEFEDDEGNTVYVIFSKEESQFVYYQDDLECHKTTSMAILGYTSNSITNENGTYSYSVSEGTLIIEDSSYNPSSFTRDQIISCANPDATGSIRIEIAFDSLPDTININHSLSSDYWSAFTLNVDIDTDENRDYSNGDLIFLFNHTFDEDRTDTEQVGLDQINAYVARIHDVDNTGPTTSRRTSDIVELNLSITENTIVLSVDKNQHKLLEAVSTTSPINVRVSSRDANGDSQSDSYPNSGTYTSESENTSDLTDELNDVTGEYSTDTIVDVSTISVTVTE